MFSHNIETDQLICRANQLTGFYMTRTWIVKHTLKVFDDFKNKQQKCMK